MDMVKKIEAKLAEFFKGLPQMSADSKESLVKAWPIIALVFGVIQLFAAYSLWHIVHVTSAISDYANSIYQTYTGVTIGLSSFDKTMLYIGILAVAIDAVILLMAYPKLKVRARGGWNLLFLGTLLNVAYAVLAIFMHGRGFGSFLSNSIGSFVSFYLLFQVRDKYGQPAPIKTDTPPTPPVAPVS